MLNGKRRGGEMLKQDKSESLVVFPEIDPDLHGLIPPALYERMAHVLTGRLRSSAFNHMVNLSHHINNHTVQNYIEKLTRLSERSLKAQGPSLCPPFFVHIHRLRQVSYHLFPAWGMIIQDCPQPV